MRCLNRNKQPVYYATYGGKEELTDEYGNYTGAYVVNYSDVSLLNVNVSPAKGASELNQFGINEDYTRTIVTDKKLPITETSVLWIGLGELSEYDSETTYHDGDICIKDGKIAKFVEADEDGLLIGDFVILPHNHVVVRVAKSINSTTYALKEVNVT